MTQKSQTGTKRYGFENQEEVLDAVQNPSNKIEFVRIMFSDILGRPMDFSIPSSELKGAFLDGKGFDGSSVEGFVRIEESDLIIKPDPKTFRVLPWDYKGFDESTAWREGIIFGDIYSPEGKPYEGDCRSVLKKVLKKGEEDLGIEAIKVGHIEAAYSLGFSRIQTMRRIVLPQAFRIVVPPVGNTFVGMLQDSALVSIIGVSDLMRQAQMIVSHTWRPFEVYTAVALLYLAMTITFSKINDYMEKRKLIIQ